MCASERFCLFCVHRREKQPVGCFESRMIYSYYSDFSGREILDPVLISNQSPCLSAVSPSVMYSVLATGGSKYSLKYREEDFKTLPIAKYRSFPVLFIFNLINFSINLGSWKHKLCILLFSWKERQETNFFLDIYISLLYISFYPISGAS